MSEDATKYIALISDIIAKQSVILGPDVAIGKARNVNNLTVGDDGTATSIEGDPTLVLKELIDEYVALSGEIVKNTLSSVFTKYPDIKQ